MCVETHYCTQQYVPYSYPADASVFPPFVLTCYQWLEEHATSVDALLRTPDRDEMTSIAELRKKADPAEIRACKNTNVVCGVLRIWVQSQTEMC